MERGYWIRSKPQYDGLAWNEKAVLHVVVAQDEGGMALLRAFEQQYPRESVRVIYSAEAPSAQHYVEVLKHKLGSDLEVCASEAEALATLAAALPSCRMGTQFYVAGTETFVWNVSKALYTVGVQNGDVRKEVIGTLARPLYCVHCKTITRDVRHNIADCSGCGRKLFVRDHFSRRLGAYMGFMVDAEEPGNVPAIEEVYP